MSLCRLLLHRTLRKSLTLTTPTPTPTPSPPPFSLTHTRSFAFTSAEEAAAERRRRKRRLRIEPPLFALRNNSSPQQRDPTQPDGTSALTGDRLSLHNRIQSLRRAGDLENASLIARQSVFSRTRPTVFSCNAIIAAMYEAERYTDAVSLFHYFFDQSGIVPNVVSYNFLIISHVDNGEVDKALEVYERLVAKAPFSPSSVSFTHLTKGLVRSGRMDDAVDKLREMLNKGLGAESLVYNNVIKGYLEMEDLGKAREFFDELKEKCVVYNGIVSATFMDWYFSRGRGKEAMEEYRSLLDREFKMVPATSNVLLEVLLKYGKKKEAWELFESLLDKHTPPTIHAVNSDTFNIMVNECFKEGKIDEVEKTFRKVGTKMGSRPFSMDVAGYTNMVVKFAERGMIEEAVRFFNELQTKSLSPHVTGYKTLIDAYLKEKRFDDAVGMYQKMVDVGLRVIPEYANRWFSELVENGKVLECVGVLTKMGEKEVKPDALTYEIVVKGLCGINAFDAVVDLVGQAMGHAVGVTPSLREFLLDVFTKEGRREEIESLMDEKNRRYWQPPRPQQNYRTPRPQGFQQGSSSGPSGSQPSWTPAGAATPHTVGPTDSPGAMRYPGPPTMAPQAAGYPAGPSGFQGPPPGPTFAGSAHHQGRPQWTPASSPQGAGPTGFQAPVGHSAGQSGWQGTPPGPSFSGSANAGYPAGQFESQGPPGPSFSGSSHPGYPAGRSESQGPPGYQAGHSGSQGPPGPSFSGSSHAGYAARQFDSQGSPGPSFSGSGHAGYSAGQSGRQSPPEPSFSGSSHLGYPPRQFNSQGPPGPTFSGSEHHHGQPPLAVGSTGYPMHGGYQGSAIAGQAGQQGPSGPAFPEAEHTGRSGSPERSDQTRLDMVSHI